MSKAAALHTTTPSAAPVGPVTTAIRAMQVQPETRPLRERAVALRERAASLIRKPPAPDPHVALRDAAILAHAEAKAVRPIFETNDPDAPRYRSAFAVDMRMRALLKQVFALPAPRTPEGLAVVGLALAIEVEGLLSTRCIENEDILASAARAILSATGAALPSAFLGFGDEPGFAAREAAMLAGPGQLPAWAEPAV